MSFPQRYSICLVLILLSGFSLTNCSSKDESPTGKVKLIFWHGLEGKFKNDLLNQKISEFNKTSARIFIIPQNYGAADRLSAKIMTAVAGDNPPDLLWWAPQQFGVLAESGLLVELDKLIAQDPVFDKDDIYPVLWEASTINGKIYSLPFETNNLAIYYNKKIFQEAGIKNLPQTWDELAETAAKLTVDTDHDGKIDRYGFQIPLGKNEWTVWVWQTFLWQAGGRIYDPQTRQVKFDGPEGAEALNFWIKLITEKVANFSEPEAGYKIGDFLAGRVAMMINGPWNFNALKNQHQVEYGSFPLPKQKVRATNIGGEHIAVLSTSEEKQKAAWEFLKYLVSAQFQIEWAVQTGYIPVSQKASMSERYQAFLKKNPFMRPFNDQMKIGRARPSIAQYTKISAALGAAIEKALYRKTDPLSALKKAAAKSNQYLSRR